VNLNQYKELFEQYKLLSGENYYEDGKEQFFEKYGEPRGGSAQLICEFRTLLEYYIDLQPKTILEIGTYHGGTLWYWVKYAPLNALIISIDVNHEQCHLWNEIEAMRPDITLVKITANSDDPKTLERVMGLTDELDFVFIDGYHHFPVVRTDWEMYGKKSKVCAFHDIGSGFDFDNPQDIRVLWNEITQEYTNTLSMIRREPTDLCYGIGIVELGENK
jgi:hypothetical protein